MYFIVKGLIMGMVFYVFGIVICVEKDFCDVVFSLLVFVVCGVIMFVLVLSLFVFVFWF